MGFCVKDLFDQKDCASSFCFRCKRWHQRKMRHCFYVTCNRLQLGRGREILVPHWKEEDRGYQEYRLWYRCVAILSFAYTPSFTSKGSPIKRVLDRKSCFETPHGRKEVL
eukprot:scaffold8152_cov195-Amphora_coffeaeformis.AAC.5